MAGAFVAALADAAESEAAEAAETIRVGALIKEHRSAFGLSDERFRRLFRLSKNTVPWLCDQLRNEEGVRRRRNTVATVTVGQQVLCALRFFGVGSFQGEVATDEHLAVSLPSMSIAVRNVPAAIVRRLGDEQQWIEFPKDEAAKASVKAGFIRRRGPTLDGVLGCIDGTFIAIKAPTERNGVTKAAYWCRNHQYALNAMVVSVTNLPVTCVV